MVAAMASVAELVEAIEVIAVTRNSASFHNTGGFVKLSHLLAT